jgi:hypothetical protein
MSEPSDQEEMTEWDRGWAAGWDDAIACKREAFYVEGARAFQEAIAYQIERFDAALAESIRSLDVEIELTSYEATCVERDEAHGGDE